MHLIFSSCDFKNENSKKVILENLGMPIEECRVLFVPNEKASPQAIRGEKFYLRLESYGFKRENIIVLDYYRTENFTDLSIDAVYVSGGNTFGTMYRLKKHGFADRLIKYVKDGAVYIGGSAGAHIASANMEHVLRYDANSNGIEDMQGLGLFDGIFICHFSAEREEHYNQLKASSPYEVYSLTNDETIVLSYNKNGEKTVNIL